MKVRINALAIIFALATTVGLIAAPKIEIINKSSFDIGIWEGHSDQHDGKEFFVGYPPHVLKAYSGEGQPEKITLENEQVEDDFALYFQKILSSEKGKEFVDILWGSLIQCVTFTPEKTAYVKFVNPAVPHDPFARLVPQVGPLRGLLKGRTQSGLRLTNNVEVYDIKEISLKARGPRESEEDQYRQLLRDEVKLRRKGASALGGDRELARIGAQKFTVRSVLTPKREQELEKQVRDEFPPVLHDFPDDPMIIHETSHNKRRSRHRRRRA